VQADRVSGRRLSVMQITGVGILFLFLVVLLAHRGCTRYLQSRSELVEFHASRRKHLSLGNALMEQGRYPQAADEFKAVLRICPDDDAARHNLRVALNRAQEAPLVATNVNDAFPPLIASQAVAFDRKCETIVCASEEFRESKGKWPGSKEELMAFCESQGAVSMQEAVGDIEDLLVMQMSNGMFQVSFRAKRPWRESGRKEQVTISAQVRPTNSSGQESHP